MRRFTLLLLWMMLVLSGYYVIHKPFDFAAAAGAAQAGARLGVVALYLLLAGSLGAAVYAGGIHPPPERAFLQLALGLGMLSLFWLGVGLAGGYTARMAWGLLVLGLALRWKAALAWLGAWRGIFPRLGMPNGWPERLLLGACAAFAAGRLLSALAPPARWDALMYHLEIPRRYLLAGKFLFLAENPYWGQPPLGSLAYTWLMALGGAPAAALLGWAVMVLASLALLSAWTRQVGGRAALVGMTALFLSPTWRNAFDWAYADAFAVLYGTALLLLLLRLRGRQETEGNLPFWAAVFIGLALWSKLTALVLLPLLPLLFRASGGVSGRRGLALLLLPAALFLPWMALLWHSTGNPLYPYLWPTPWVDADRMAYFAYRGASLPLPALAAAPLSAAWFGLEGAVIPGLPPFGADLGPWLVLLAVPGVWRAWRETASGRRLTAYFFLWWGATAFGGFYSPLLVQPRLYLALWPGLGLLAAFGWQQVASVRWSAVRLGRVASALLALSMVFALWTEGRTLASERPFAPLLGLESEETYLHRLLGPYETAMRALETLPEGARPLFLWEPRGFYAPPPAAADTWIDRWYLARRTGASAAEIAGRWRAAGYTHLLLNRTGAEFELRSRPAFSTADRRALDDLLASLPLLADFDGAYQLYALLP